MPEHDAFVGQLRPEARAELERLGHLRLYRAGSWLFHQGDRSHTVYIVHSGVLKLTRSAANGRVTLLGFRGPGRLVGEQATLHDAPRNASALIVTDASIQTIPNDDFLDLIERDHDVALGVIRSLSDRLSQASRFLVDLASADAAGRVAQRLVDLAEDTNLGLKGHALPVSQQELANWTALSRESVVKALARFREAGWVSTGRGRVTVEDLAALRAYAEQGA